MSHNQLSYYIAIDISVQVIILLYKIIPDFITNLYVILVEIPKFHLISWCGNFEERHNFHRVLRNSSEISRNCAFPQNFHPHQDLVKILVFYAVKVCYSYFDCLKLVLKVYKWISKFLRVCLILTTLEIEVIGTKLSCDLKCFSTLWQILNCVIEYFVLPESL